MEDVTFREWCELKGYGKGKSFNLTMLAEKFNCSLSYISKMYNNRALASCHAEMWLYIKGILAKDGYNLINANRQDSYTNNHIRENEKLHKRIEELEAENEKLKDQLKSLEKMVKLARKICMMSDESGV